MGIRLSNHSGRAAWTSTEKSSVRITGLRWPSRMGLVPVQCRRASCSSHLADGIAGTSIARVVYACAGRRSGTNTHLLLAINLKELHARCPVGAPVRLKIHVGFWRSPKEHPVAPLAGAVNPRWARGDSMNVVVGFDTRFEAWRECNSRSSQPAAPVRWSWTDGSGVKYSPGVPSFGGAPRHVMATCTDAASVRAADSGVARCDRVVAAALLRNGRCVRQP